MINTCIIIPTNERREYLRRCISYYGKFSCQIVICDSSVVAYPEKINGNIIYYHLPGMKFAEKILFALSVINENFVGLAPDDDFLFEGALIRGVEILKKNVSLQACVGDVLGFPERPPFRVVARTDGRRANAISSSAELNIRTYLANYHQILWSLFKHDTLKSCFEIIEKAKFVNENFFEMSIATFCAGKGGICYLDDYWILRELSQSDHWGFRHPPITYARLSLMDKDISIFRKLVDNALFSGAGDLALSAYLSGENPLPNKFVLINRIINYATRQISRLHYSRPEQIDWINDIRFLPIREVMCI